MGALLYYLRFDSCLRITGKRWMLFCFRFDQLWPDVSPIVWAQVAAGDGTLCETLDDDASLHRHAASLPIADRGHRDAEGACHRLAPAEAARDNIKNVRVM